MKYLRVCLTVAIFLCLSGRIHGQAWSGILSPTRASDWSSANPGVIGGVPSANWAQCGSTISAYGSSGAPVSPATINNAIAGCGTNTFVLLGAGAFYLNSGIVMKSNVVLRGMGANSTSIIFSGNSSCGGLFAAVCLSPSTYYYFGSQAAQPGGTNAASWISGYAQGSTTITLSNLGSAGLTNGQYLFLDQANDSSDNKSFFICDNTTAPCSLEGGSPGRNIGGVDRNQIQIVKVVSGCANACSGSGPFTVTITPGIYAANYRSSQSPGAWWISFLQNAGVENLSVDLSASGGYSGFVFSDAANCWMSGVRSMRPNRNHVWLMEAAHVTVQNSYFYGTQNAASQSYGVESYVASDNLVANNIFQQVTTPIMMGPSQGSAFVFNYTNNNTYYAAGWLPPSVAGGHDAGAIYNLFEGNIGTSWLADVFHGTSGLNTIFRNRLVGWELKRLTNTVPVVLYSYNRYNNFIGNVLGHPGYHNTYQTSLGTGATTSIFDFGAGNVERGVSIPNDPLVAPSVLRWGNYDTVTSAVRWCGDSSSQGWSTICGGTSEIPSKLTDIYANPVPTNTNLPASLLFSSIPKWWPAGKPWPLIGPDVSGGNIAGLAGHANSNPAQDCYNNVMGGPSDGTGAILSFNANTCYPSGSNGPPPKPPTNLLVISVQ